MSNQTLPWIAFAAALPTESPILVSWVSFGDPWESMVEDANTAFPTSRPHMDEPTPFVHLEVLTVDQRPMGIGLFRDEGRGKELSRHEYEQLLTTGYWITLQDFYTEHTPHTGWQLVNGGNGQPINGDVA